LEHRARIVLRSQELGVQVNGSILRIAEQKTSPTNNQSRKESEKISSIPRAYTEFIRLILQRLRNNNSSGLFQAV
jgi:hypothetical protein